MSDIKGLSIGLDMSTIGIERSVTAIKNSFREVRQAAKVNLNNIKFDTKNVDNYKRNLDQLNNAFKMQKSNVEGLKRELDKLEETGKGNTNEAQRLRNEINKQTDEMNRLERAVESTTKELQKMELAQQGAKWTDAGKGITDFSDKLKTVGQGMKDVGGKMTAAITLPLVGLGGGAIKAATDFESAFAGVKKTVDMSESGFEALETSIRDMSKELPFAATEIAGVAESAGQLGIQNENIEGFTKTILDMGVATNLSTEQAATDFARFANIVQMPQENFDRLGSSVVALGNNLATTESEIVSMGMRLAGIGAQVGLTEAEIMALAAAMSSVGIEAEAGGSSMTAVMKKIQNAVSAGGADLELFAQASGLSASEFAKQWESSPITALESFIAGLAESGESGENLNVILGELGISGIRETDTLLRMAGASDVLSEAVDLSTNAWEENTALGAEAEVRYETMASQIQIMKNRLVDLGIQIGEILMPIFSNLLDKIGEGIDWFSGLNDETKENIVQWGLVAAAIGPVLSVIGSMSLGVSALLAPIGKLSMWIGAKGGLVPALGLLGTSLKGIVTFMLGPWGIGIAAAILAITGLVSYFRQEATPAVDEYGNVIESETGEMVTNWDVYSSGVKDRVANTGKELKTGIENIKEWAGNVKSRIQDTGTELETGASNFTTFFTNIGTGLEFLAGEMNATAADFDQWLLDMGTSLSNWWNTQTTNLGNWWNGIATSFQNWLDDNSKRYNTFRDNLAKTINNQWTNLTNNLSTWWNGILTNFQNWLNNKITRFNKFRADLSKFFSDLWTTLTKNLSGWWNNIANNFSTWLNNKIKSVSIFGGNLRKSFSDIWTSVTNSMSNAWDGIKRKYDGFLNGLVKGARDIGKGLRNAFASAFNSGIGSVSKGVNKIIDGINWVLGKLGVGDSKIGKWNFVPIPQYAKGTKAHPGGAAIVGDGGMKELIMTPKGDTYMSPATDTLVDLPKGTQVLSGPNTRKLMDELQIPEYKNGIGEQIKDMGSQIWDWMSGGAKNVLDKAIGMVGGGQAEGPGIFKPIAKGAISMIKNAAASYLESKMSAMMPDGGWHFPGMTFTSGFGQRWGRMHEGIDMAAPSGTPIPSQSGGVVTGVGYRPQNSGNYVDVKQGAWSYHYYHMLRQMVKRGQEVTRGQILGLVGSTGRSTGPHLHFEVRKNGRAIDPMSLGGAGGGGGGGGNSGMGQWTSVAAQALRMTGQYSANNLSRLLMQMKSESGGNARAINNWDSNARRGTPSKGLMQVIDPTFRAYQMPGYGNIWNPLDNILASIRYSVSRYGSLTRAWRGVGYATGGLINEDGLYRLAEGGHPEFVIPTDPARKTDAMKLLALAGKRIQGGSNKRPNELSSPTSSKEEVKGGDTYHIHITANGDLPASVIRKMADKIEEEIKKKQDRKRMSKGQGVSFA